MLGQMIELQIHKVGTGYFPEIEGALCVDGRVLKTSLFQQSTDSERQKRYVVTVLEKAFHLLHSYRFNEIPEEINDLTIGTAESTPALRIAVLVRKDRVRGSLACFVDVHRQLTHWKFPWSPAEFRSTLKEVAESQPCETLTWHEDPKDQLRELMIRFTCNDAPGTALMGEFFSPLVDKIGDWVRQATEQLRSKVDSDSLIAYFDFPAAVRTPCEQYLLYFVEFLADIGVDAKADLRHEMGRVLFAVTPQTSGDALIRIKEALEVYLNLPTATIVGDVDAISDMRIQQLRANVSHLQGQLMLAGAIVQAKDKSIESMEATILSLRKTLAGNVMGDSLKALDTSSGAKTEELIPGLVTVEEYKGKGFTINLPELLRRLRAGLPWNKDT